MSKQCVLCGKPIEDGDRHQTHCIASRPGGRRTETIERHICYSCVGRVTKTDLFTKYQDAQKQLG